MMSLVSRTLTPGALLAMLSPNVAAQLPVDVPGSIRVGLRARLGGADRLTSLRYVGGFETKTLLLETLVQRAPDGRIVGGLASRWSARDGGRTFAFELREGARFHDGTPVTANAVCEHLRRWIGHEEHDWLRVNRRIQRVEPPSETSFAVYLDQPYALLADLVAINPCAVVSPTSTDWEGEFVRPIGTGPFRFVGAFDDGTRWRLTRANADAPTIDVTFYPRGRDTRPIDDLICGNIDVFVGGWDEDLPFERLTEIDQDPRFRLVTAPGSSVVYLSFRLSEGPTVDPDVRRRIANAIDRAELIRIVEGGRADPCATWAAPSVAFWPGGPASKQLRDRRARAAVLDSRTRDSAQLVTISVSGGRGGRAARVAIEVVEQLRRAGFDASYLAPPAHLREASRVVVDAHGAVRPLTTESGEVRRAASRGSRARSAGADISVHVTHGMPYCPHQSLVSRFGTHRRSEPEREGKVLAALAELVDDAAATPDENARIPIYSQIQNLMDREVVIVPLFSPWRIAMTRADVDGVHLGPDVYRVDLSGMQRVETK